MSRSHLKRFVYRPAKSSLGRREPVRRNKQLGRGREALVNGILLFAQAARLPSVACAGIVPDPLQTLEPVASPDKPEPLAVAFRAGTGGLHSAEN